ncbi:hypothetical protein [Symmachiella dynata]|uniref:hypothetical protein n=1 Tax=Symmachiella dynata TaxID=2527995 RepID=UPI0011AB0629|nr:hypothetical protein [Symmachiella dynata]
MSDFLTVGESARVLDRPQWQVRNVVDSMPEQIPRAGRYRLIARSLLTDVAAELARRYPRKVGAIDED